MSAFLESYVRTRSHLQTIIAMECTAKDDRVLINTCELLVSKKYTEAYECIKPIQVLLMSPEFNVIGLNLLATFKYLMGKGIRIS